jgi:hypothetical protein
MNLFRSEIMLNYQLALPKENAIEILSELGEINCVQIED